MSEREKRGRLSKENESLKQIIQDTYREFRKIDLLIILFAIEEAYDNLLNHVRGTIIATEKSDDVLNRQNEALGRYISQTFIILLQMFDLCLHNSTDGVRTLQAIPRMSIYVSPYSEDWLLREVIRTGGLSPNDLDFNSRQVLSNAFRISRLIVLKDGKVNGLGEPVMNVLQLLKRTRTQLQFETALERGFDFEFGIDSVEGETSISLKLGREEITSINIEELQSLRHSVDASWAPTDWAADLRAAGETTLRHIGEGQDSSLGRPDIERENGEIYKAYSSFKGFPELFRSKFSYSLEEFLDVSNAVAYLTYPWTTRIIVDVPRRFETKVSGECRITKPPKMHKILASLIQDNPDQFDPAKPLLKIGSFQITSYRRAASASQVFLSEFFDGEYDRNPTGQRFEEKTRKTLRDSGFPTYPERVEVPFPMWTLEDSQKFGIKHKRETDIDVVARKESMLLVMECKEIIAPLEKQTRIRNKFNTVCRELSLKTQWISNNLERFQELMKPGYSGLFEGDFFVVPLFVSTFPVEIDPEIGVGMLTISELRKVSPKFESFFEKDSEGRTNLNIRGLLGRPQKSFAFSAKEKSIV